MSESNKKILIIDDEKDINEAATTALKDEGFEVSSAYDGKEGLEMALKDHPDLIFLDIIMPELDGIEVLTKLREDDWGKSADVIVMSVVDDMEKIADVVEKNGGGYILKSDTTLEEVVKKAKQRLN